MTFSCSHTPLKTQYTIDGGKQSGIYNVKLCNDCDKESDFKYIIKKEKLK